MEVSSLFYGWFMSKPDVENQIVVLVVRLFPLKCKTKNEVKDEKWKYTYLKTDESITWETNHDFDSLFWYGVLWHIWPHNASAYHPLWSINRAFLMASGMSSYEKYCSESRLLSGVYIVVTHLEKILAYSVIFWCRTIQNPGRKRFVSRHHITIGLTH